MVAIKHIYKGFNLNTFTREVKGLSGVRHPNLVCLFGFCTEDEEQYLVYEHCSNGNLAQHLLSRSLFFLIKYMHAQLFRLCDLVDQMFCRERHIAYMGKKSENIEGLCTCHKASPSSY